MQSTPTLLAFIFLTLLHFCAGLPCPNSAGDIGSSVTKGNQKFTRSNTTCADPSLAGVLSQAFQPLPVIHLIAPQYEFDTVNTQNGAETWVSVRDIFRGWATQQPSTLPLWQLGSFNRQEYIYQMGQDATTPPVVSGFPNDIVIAAWVYGTQVCDSIPLLSAVYPAKTDHIYTTATDQHEGLVSWGWMDSGVVAYVLPLTIARSPASPF